MKLQSLKLQGKNISSIEDRVFQNLTKLKLLFLSSNQLLPITKDLFSGLFNLKCLHLEDNRINKIDLGAFADLNNVSYLDLSENDLYYLEKDIFEGLHKIKTINFSDNHIFEIGKGSLSYLYSQVIHFPKEIKIIAADNSIQELRWDLFVGYDFLFQNLHQMHVELSFYNLNCKTALCWMNH